MIAINEKKAPSPAELAEIIRGLREKNEWSQAALAASANLSERTIQRVERAKGSNRQTRRSLARAFCFEDHDIFEKPMQIPSVESTLQKPTLIPGLDKKLQDSYDALMAQSDALTAKVENSKVQISAAMAGLVGVLEKHTELIQITPIRSGRTLHAMLEQANYCLCCPMEFGDHTPAAREAFAELADYLDDYCQLHNARRTAKEILRELEQTNGRCTMERLHTYHLSAKESLRRTLDRMKFAHTPAAREAFCELDASAKEKIGVDADLDTLLATISEQHCIVGAGLQHDELCDRSLDPPLCLEAVHIVLAREAAFPVNIRVGKHGDRIIPTIPAPVK